VIRFSKDDDKDKRPQPDNALMGFSNPNSDLR
jgi:hypothetical protein